MWSNFDDDFDLYVLTSKRIDLRKEKMEKDAVVSRYVYLEEYKKCGCSFATRLKRDLPGYCPIHGTDRKRCTKLPDPKNTFGLGFVN